MHFIMVVIGYLTTGVADINKYTGFLSASG